FTGMAHIAQRTTRMAMAVHRRPCRSRVYTGLHALLAGLGSERVVDEYPPIFPTGYGHKFPRCGPAQTAHQTIPCLGLVAHTSALDTCCGSDGDILSFAGDMVSRYLRVGRIV